MAHATTLHGVTLQEIMANILRSTPEEETTIMDGLRFYNENGDPVYMLADGYVYDAVRGGHLVQCTSLTGTIEYVLRADPESTRWTLVYGGERKSRLQVTFKDARSLS